MDPIRLGIIPRLLTKVDNLAFNLILSINEVQEVIFSIDADSVIGLDKFSSLFYQHCWDIIKDDVYGTIIHFFEGSHLPRSFTTTSIVLLPKKENVVNGRITDLSACVWRLIS